MPTGGPSRAGPQSWGFMPTGPTRIAAMAANTVTLTIAQYVSTAPYAPQCQFWNIGTDEAFVTFGSNTVTVATTSGVPIVPTSKMSKSGQTGGPRGMQILTTGKRPQQFCVIGSAGTSTVYITPGEGHR